MAANLAGETALDRRLRIQTWREKAVSQGLGQNTSLATQLCVECMAFYRHILRQLSQNTCLSKPTFTKLTRIYEALALWAHGYDIAHGGLDEALLTSRRARRCYLESFTSLCTTLLSRLLPLFPTLRLDDEARTLKRTVDAGSICLEDTYQDCDSTGSTSDRSTTLEDDNIDEIIKDLGVDIDGLIAMESLITCPADRSQEEPRESASTTWAPHHAICERVENRFPMASKSIVQSLGQATWDSFLRCKELREKNELRRHNEEAPEVVAQTVVASERSKDSGLGSSLPTSYAETIMSYRRQDGESIKIPPLPKSAFDGVPFACIVCGGTIVARTDSAWKKHIFGDLRPYLCVFEPCSRMADPFESRHEWVSHVVYHVIELNGKLDAETTVVNCPLCLEDMKGGYVKHISAHLEEVALGAVSHRADVDSEQGTAGTDTEEDQDRDDDDEESTKDKWCFCRQTAGSGVMVQCDNKDCEVSWFHPSCVGLDLAHGHGPWYCSVCTARRVNTERGIGACYHCRDRKIDCITTPDTITRCFSCANNHWVCQFPLEGHPRPSLIEPTPNRIELSGNQEKLDRLYTEATEAMLEIANMTKSDVGAKASPSADDNSSVHVPDVKVDDINLDWDQIIPDEQLAIMKAEEGKKKNDEYLAMVQEENVPRKAAPLGFEGHIESSRTDSPEGFIERFGQPPAPSLDRPGSPSLDESFTWVNASRRSPVKSPSSSQEPPSLRLPPALPSQSTSYSRTKPTTELSDRDSFRFDLSDTDLQRLRAMEEQLKVENERVKAENEQIRSQLSLPVFDQDLELQRLRAENEQLKARLASSARGESSKPSGSGSKAGSGSGSKSQQQKKKKVITKWLWTCCNCSTSPMSIDVYLACSDCEHLRCANCDVWKAASHDY